MKFRMDVIEKEDAKYASIELLNADNEPYHTVVWLWDEKANRWKFGFEADIVDVKMVGNLIENLSDTAALMESRDGEG